MAGSEPAGGRGNPLHLVWVPGSVPEGDASRIESLLGTGAYEARLLARSRSPRLLRTLGDAREARSLLEQAQAMGLRAFLVEERSLETHPPIEAVEEARVQAAGVHLRAASGEFPVTDETVELLVASRVEVRRHRTSTRISMLPAETGATPGLPKVVRQTRTTGEHLGVLDVYRSGQERGFRVREESTVFSSADAGAAHPSALLRFHRLVGEVRRAAPASAFDDRFSLFDDLDTSRARRTRIRPGVTVLDGIARFERYSRLLWFALRCPDPSGPGREAAREA